MDLFHVKQRVPSADRKVFHVKQVMKNYREEILFPYTKLPEDHVKNILDIDPSQ